MDRGCYPFIWSTNLAPNFSPATGFAIFQTPFGTFPTADTASDFITFTSTDSLIKITGNSATTTIDFSHALSGATAGTYGSGSLIPVIQVNASGHITSISTVAALSSIPAANVTFSPAIPSQWQTPLPTNVDQALNNLAGLASNDNIDGGVASTVYGGLAGIDGGNA